MKATDFPGLTCDDCGETPRVLHSRPSIILNVGTGEATADWWAVSCRCGEYGPFAESAPEAVVAWEAGKRARRSTREGREEARIQRPA